MRPQQWNQVNYVSIREQWVLQTSGSSQESWENGIGGWCVRGAVAYAGRDSAGDVIAGGVLIGDSTPLYAYTSLPPPPLTRQFHAALLENIARLVSKWTQEAGYWTDHWTNFSMHIIYILNASENTNTIAIYCAMCILLQISCPKTHELPPQTQDPPQMYQHYVWNT